MFSPQEKLMYTTSNYLFMFCVPYFLFFLIFSPREKSMYITSNYNLVILDVPCFIYVDFNKLFPIILDVLTTIVKLMDCIKLSKVILDVLCFI